MPSEVSPSNEEFIQQALDAGLYSGRGQLLDEAVRLLREEQETIAAIQDGLASIERGDGVPLEEADAQLRRKHGMPNRP